MQVRAFYSMEARTKQRSGHVESSLRKSSMKATCQICQMSVFHLYDRIPKSTYPMSNQFVLLLLWGRFPYSWDLLREGYPRAWVGWRSKTSRELRSTGTSTYINSFHFSFLGNMGTYKIGGSPPSIMASAVLKTERHSCLFTWRLPSKSALHFTSLDSTLPLVGESRQLLMAFTNFYIKFITWHIHSVITYNNTII